MTRKTITGLKIIFAFFLFVSFAGPVSGSIKKNLYARITLKAKWEITDKDTTSKGSLTYRIKGKLDVNKSISSTENDMPAFLVPYRFSQVSANYTYQETVINNNPPLDCPKTIIAKYKGSGSAPFRPAHQFGDFYAQYLGNIMKTLGRANVGDFQGAGIMVDFYRFHTVGQEFTVQGKMLRDCEYVNAEKTVLTEIKLGEIIAPDGKISGQEGWSSKFNSGSPSFDVEVYNLPPTMGEEPFSPEKSPMGNTNYTLSWYIGEQQPPDIFLKTVSFNYEKNKNEEIVMDLKKLDDGSLIESPEWIKDSKYEPAAFVLGKPFEVRAVFRNEGQEISKLKIWAEEDVVEGDGGFGGIEEKTVDIKNGEFSVDFKIKKTQETIGKNRVTWNWKFKDTTAGKEEVAGFLGESRHTIYITGRDSGGKVLDQSPKSTNPYNSFVYIVRRGCELGGGTTGGKQTFDQIWSIFWNIPGPDDSTILKYDHNDKGYHKEGVNQTKRLLTTYAGPCGAWQEFFYDMNACQGIKVEKINIHPKPPFNVFIVGQRKAQGNSSPYRAFLNHSINAYQGQFYDPSYGLETNRDFYAYESEAFVAYCNSKEAQIEDQIKNWVNSALVDLFGNCYKQWFADEPNDNALADCLMKNSDKCAPNNPYECELLECTE